MDIVQDTVAKSRVVESLFEHIMYSETRYRF